MSIDAPYNVSDVNELIANKEVTTASLNDSAIINAQFVGTDENGKLIVGTDTPTFTSVTNTSVTNAQYIGTDSNGQVVAGTDSPTFTSVTYTENVTYSAVPNAQYIGTNSSGDLEAGTLTPTFTSVSVTDGITANSVTVTGLESAAYLATNSSGELIATTVPAGLTSPGDSIQYVGTSSSGALVSGTLTPTFTSVSVTDSISVNTSSSAALITVEADAVGDNAIYVQLGNIYLGEGSLVLSSESEMVFDGILSAPYLVTDGSGGVQAGDGVIDLTAISLIPQANTVVDGPTAGTMTPYYICSPVIDTEVDSYYKELLYTVSGYENDTTTSQTISFPTDFGFVNNPIIDNNTGLTITYTVGDNSFVVSAPDTTTTYSGTIIFRGI